MGKKITLSIILDEDTQQISLVDIEGRQHYMCDEPPSERNRYLNITTREFIADYVHYYRSSQSGEATFPADPRPGYRYAIRIKDQFYCALDKPLVSNPCDAYSFNYEEARNTVEYLRQCVHTAQEYLGISYAPQDVAVIKYDFGRFAEALSYYKIAAWLCAGLGKTAAEISHAAQWLAEYGTANDLSLHELNEMCWEDSTWFLDEIFG